MPRLSQDDRDLIYRLRHENNPPWSWAHIQDNYFPDQLRSSLRRVASDENKKHHPPAAVPVPTPTIEGATIAEGDDVDEEELWRLALQKSEKRRQVKQLKQDNRISFAHGPICLVFVADQHAGSLDTDYARIAQDAQIINDTPGMYSVAVGDIVDNFIIGRLKQIRIGTEFSVTQEWVLAKRVLKLMAPKMIASISGNHDLWTYALTGIDYLKEIHRELNPDILYAKYDLPFILTVGDWKYRIRARHSWPGYSQFNDTHGIEKATKFDKSNDFDIGIGAHTHASGLAKEFNNGGKTAHAILCGSYKVDGDFKEQRGFPGANESAAVCMVFTEDGEWGTNKLEATADYMRTMYKPS